MNELENDQSPEWMVKMITETCGTQAVRTRMREAGAVAFALARMRSEKQNIGFVPLPFGEYLQGLAKLAGVAMDPVLRWAAIRDFTVFEAKEATGLGRLARTLGFAIEELFLSLRISVAEHAGGAPLPMLAAHRGASGAVTISQCDRALHQLESSWPNELKTEADAFIEAAAMGYRQRALEETTETL